MALSSCGGSSCETTTQILAIDAQCNIANDISSYTPLQSGDIISKDEENTTINILHDQSNNKVACVESGGASIIRGV